VLALNVRVASVLLVPDNSVLLQDSGISLKPGIYSGPGIFPSVVYFFSALSLLLW